MYIVQMNVTDDRDKWSEASGILHMTLAGALAEIAQNADDENRAAYRVIDHMGDTHVKVAGSYMIGKTRHAGPFDSGSWSGRR